MRLALGLLLGLLLLAALGLGRRRAERPRKTLPDGLPPGRKRAPKPAPAPAPLPSVSELSAVFAPVEAEEEPATLLYRGPALLEDADLRDVATLPPPPGHPSRVQLTYELEADEAEVTSPRARILVAAQGDSDQGKVRRQNEDCLLFIPERQLFAIADGMGGHAGGRVASTLAVQHLREAFERESFRGPFDSKHELPRRGRELVSAVVQSNTAVREMARADPELSNMGTTLVAARFSPNNQRVYIAHVGDSRCYRFRAGKLRQLTVDHTMRQVGLVGPGADHLFQALGVTEQLSIDLVVDKPLPEDLYLLCSDGLTKMVSDENIRAQLVEEPDLEAAVYGLIERANDAGGRDNVSVVLVKVLERAIPTVVSTATWTKLPKNGSALWELGNDEPTVIGQSPLDQPRSTRRADEG
jgi:serine/threonine protein phosphatase PrpC